MALNKMIASFFSRALAMGALPPGGDLLEFGESIVVTYDKPQELLEIVAPNIPEDRLLEARRRIDASGHNKSAYQQAFGPARAFYHAVFEPASYMAVELGLAPRRLCIDMNAPVEVTRQFDYVINNGTSEHIFDQANVYRVIHDYTRAGGVMIHWTPCFGWANHGLFNVQPGFFFDLATANGYEIKLIGLASGDVFFPLQNGDGYREGLRQHPVLAHSLVCVVLHKKLDAPFQPPMQGYYQGGAAHAYALSKVPRQHIVDPRPNLALNKPALQSSTCKYSWHDDPALDAAGGNNGMIIGFYGFHTDREFEPWWMVDLGAPVPIHEVVAYNRLDTVPGAAGRSAHLRIYFSQDGTVWEQMYARSEDTPFGGADGNPLRVKFDGQQARFVRIGLPGNTILYLDEIEVY